MRLTAAPMRLTAAFAVLGTLAATPTTAQQPVPVDNQAKGNLSVNKGLIVRGVPIGQVFERFRPQVGAYLKEIEDAGDYPNWKAPPSKAYER